MITKQAAANWRGYPDDIKKDTPDYYPWRKCYVWYPVQTISGRYAWFEQLYKRRVWVYLGSYYSLCYEPETQYATLLELLMVD